MLLREMLAATLEVRLAFEKGELWHPAFTMLSEMVVTSEGRLTAEKVV